MPNPQRPVAALPAAKALTADERARANQTGTQLLATISDSGTIASQNANSVVISGGRIEFIADLVVSDGGTGASLPANARINLGLPDGTYTPVLTNVLNLDASTAYQGTYLQVGETVMVTGHADVDPTAAGVAKLGITLPVESGLGVIKNCAGTAFAPAIAGQGAAILADTTNNRAQMEWIAVDTANRAMYFTFSYQITKTRSAGSAVGISTVVAVGRALVGSVGSAPGAGTARAV